MLTDMIVIVPYDPDWPKRYADEERKVREALGGALVVRIDHVGSTSVPGLAAKPVIDIQVSVPSVHPLLLITGPLSQVGYTHIPEPDEEFERVYPLFCKPAIWPSSHHIHVCAAGSEQERRHLAFRDYLRGHPETATEYVDLKYRLAASHDGASTESRERYAMAKTEFVEGVLQRAFERGYPRA
jgi:GrpB-like predicted nucleotidyltransferase (UPF0157 family)